MLKSILSIEAQKNDSTIEIYLEILQQTLGHEAKGLSIAVNMGAFFMSSGTVSEKIKFINKALVYMTAL